MAGLFDDLESGAKTAGSSGGGMFDDLLTPKSSIARRLVGDTAISALKSAIAVPEAAVGIADLVTGGKAGKILENEGGIGFRPKEAKAILDEYLSPEQKTANEKLAQADGFVDTLATAVDYPSTILHTGIESIAPMLAGGVVARGVMAAPGVAGKVAPWVAGAIGEGTISAGMGAESIRQQTEDGLLTGEQAGLAGLAGVGTGLIGAGGAKIAQKLGIGEIDTLLAGGNAGAATTKGIARKAAEGAAVEGVFQELPQSTQEQALQNIALGKPWDQGLGNAAAMGLLTGAALGGIAGPLGGKSLVQPQPTAENPAPASVPAPDPAAGPISRSAAQLPGPSIAGLLPDPGQTLYGDAAGNLSPDGPSRNVDREYRPTGRERGPQTFGPGMDQSVPMGESAPLEGELIRGAGPYAGQQADARQPQTYDNEQSLGLPAPSIGIPDMRPEAMIVDSQGQAVPGRATTLQPITPEERADGMTAQAVPGQRPGYQQVLERARQGGVSPDAIVAELGATKAQAIRAVKAARAEEVALGVTFSGMPGANKARKALPDPDAFEAVRVAKGEWRLQRSPVDGNSGSAGEGEPGAVRGIDARAESESEVTPALELQSQTEEELADADAANKARIKAEEKAQAEADEKKRKADEAAFVKQQNEAANAGFQLGQNAEDNLSGQGSIFDAAPAQAEPATVTAKPDEADAQRFITAPDGSTDFGEITSDMAKAAGRQGGKIRLQQGNESWGLQHIEQRHGAEIRDAGFADVPAFVADIAQHIDQVWKPAATRQLVALHKVGNNRMMFVELQPGKDEAGDFYTVNTAFTSRKAEKKGWKLLWEARAQASGESGNRPSFAVSPPVAGGEVTNPSSQSSEPSIAPPAGDKPAAKPKSKPDAKLEDAGDQLKFNKKGMFRSGGLKWSDIASENDALKVKLAGKEKIWARPSWEQIIEAQPADQRDGFRMAAHLVKQVYDALPKQAPVKTDEGIQQYIEAVTELRAAAEAFLGDGDALAGVLSGLSQKAANRMSRSFSILDMQANNKISTAPLFAALFPEQAAGKRFERGTPANTKGQMIGSKAIKAMQWGADDAVKAMKAIKAGWPAKQEAWEKQGYAVHLLDSAMTGRYFGMDDGKIAAHLLLGGRSVDELGIFDTRTKAEAAVEAKSKELVGQFLVLDKRKRMLGAFLTEAEATDFARAQVARKAEPEQQAAEQASEEWDARTGEPRRPDNKDVSPEDLIEAFGFRGVNFGNWVKQGERRRHLNAAYDAFADLAELLGMPPKAVSLNGMLGVAFGAQGGGKFAAHFVPGVNEINITKTRGAGSLAHEWAHALDHYFGTQAGLARSANPFASTLQGMSKYARGKLENVQLRPEIEQAFNNIVDVMRSRVETPAEVVKRRQDALQKAKEGAQVVADRLRPRLEGNAEALKALDAVMEGEAGEYVNLPIPKGKRKPIGAIPENIKTVYDALGYSSQEAYDKSYQLHRVALAKEQLSMDVTARSVHTQFYRNSMVLDGKKTPYWSTQWEMFARGFESWVMDALALRGAANNYLVGEGKADEAQLDDSPYPRGSERALLNDAFGKLAAEIKFRQADDGNVPLFSRGPAGGAIFGAGRGDVAGAAGAVVEHDAVEAIIKRIGDRLGLSAPIIAYRNEAALFAAVPEIGRQAEKDGAKGQVNAVFYRGKVHVVTRAFARAADVEMAILDALAHEGQGHHGIRAMYGNDAKAVDAALREVFAAIGGVAGVKRLAAKNSLDLSLYLKTADGMSERQRAGFLADELLAHLQGRAATAGLSQRAMAAIKAYLGAVREWLRGHGFPNLAKGTDADIALLLKRMREAAQRKPTGRGLAARFAVASSQVRFRRAAGVTTDAFKRWFGASKVVNKQGEPKILYHGTGEDFTVFDQGRSGSSTRHNTAPLGIFMTGDRDTAQAYADKASDGIPGYARVMQLYAAIRNPYMMSVAESLAIASPGEAAALRGKLEREGYDGINLKGTDTWVAFSNTQVKSATDNNGEYDEWSGDIRFKRTADFADALKGMAGGSGTGRTADAFTDLDQGARDFLNKVGTQPAMKRASDWVRERTERAATKIRQGIVDRYAALKELDEKLLGKDFIENAIHNSSWVLARMSSAASGAMNAMLTTGRLRFDAKERVITLQDDDASGGLGAVLSQLGPAAEVERFMGWIAANRASKLMAEGRENLFTAEEIASGKQLNAGRTDDGRSRPMLYAQVFTEFQQYRDDVLAIAEATGIISAESRAMWRDEFYVPFYRVMNEDATAGGPQAGKGLSRQEAYKKLKGGKQNLNDLLENTLMNFHHLLSASLKNQAAAQTMSNAEKVGIARVVPESRRDPKTSTFVLEKGERVFYEIDDPLVFEALTALADPGLNNLAVQTMAAFKRFFTNMTTVTPQFILANTMRDLMQASATSPTSKNLFKNTAQGLAGYRDAKTRAQMQASGGAFSFGHLYGADVNEVKASLNRTVKGAQLITDPSMIPKILRAGWRKWGDVADTAENISRAATYLQNVEQKGRLRAAYEARDIMDFSQHGAWPAVRFLIRVVPFLNARLQGLDKLYRSGVKPSLLTAMGKGTEGDKAAAARFATVTGALTVASIALYLANADDDEYRKLEDWQKDSYWFFRIGDNAFFLPKPFEVGAIATMAERLTEQMVDDKATGKLFADRLKDMLTQTFSFSPVPQMFQPVLDIYSNKDAFTGRDIESMGMDRLSKGLRSRENTTAAATALSAVSRALGDESPVALSPVQADHLIRGYFGTVGATAAGLVDTIWRGATGQESPDKSWSEYQPIRRFYRDLGAPAPYTRYSTLFYEGLREANRVYADVRELQSLGKTDEAREVSTDKRGILAMRLRLNQQQRRISEINKQMETVKRSDRDGAWKRRELDRLTLLRNRITEQAGMQIENVRAQD